jgi:regulator of sigma E protease
MAVLETIFYFGVTIGVLVFVHEFGHFIAAKLCGMRAEVFALGMGPRLFGYNKLNGFTFWKLDESLRLGENTDYRVAVLPLGGYVKIAGMIDESFDTDHLDRPPEPWEFRARPIWQRMIVISAGVIMNILLAVAIFWGINYARGKVIQETTQIGYVQSGSPAERAGFKAYDRVVQINGKPVEHWDEVMNLVYIEAMAHDLTIDVVRSGSNVRLLVPRANLPDPNDTSFGIIPAHTQVIVEQVDPGKPAGAMGLKAGDELIMLNGDSVQLTQQVIDIIGAHPEQPVTVEWRREGVLMTGTATPSSEGRIGISIGMRYAGPQREISYSLFEALPPAFTDIVWITGRSVQQIWLIISGEASLSKNVGGPIKIAQFATQSAGLGMTTFLGFMAVLSISLAILNILPIPALDGGHFLFLVYEGTFRREIPTRVKIGIQKAGMALLIAFTVFVMYNDIINF